MDGRPNHCTVFAGRTRPDCLVSVGQHCPGASLELVEELFFGFCDRRCIELKVHRDDSTKVARENVLTDQAFFDCTDENLVDLFD